MRPPKQNEVVPVRAVIQSADRRHDNVVNRHRSAPLPDRRDKHLHWGFSNGMNSLILQRRALPLLSVDWYHPGSPIQHPEGLPKPRVMNAIFSRVALTKFPFSQQKSSGIEGSSPLFWEMAECQIGPQEAAVWRWTASQQEDVERGTHASPDIPHQPASLALAGRSSRHGSRQH